MEDYALNTHQVSVLANPGAGCVLFLGELLPLFFPLEEEP